jgi:hypothetical protein
LAIRRRAWQSRRPSPRRRKSTTFSWQLKKIAARILWNFHEFAAEASLGADYSINHYKVTFYDGFLKTFPPAIRDGSRW